MISGLWFFVNLNRSDIQVYSIAGWVELKTLWSTADCKFRKSIKITFKNIIQCIYDNTYYKGLKLCNILMIK